MLRSSTTILRSGLEKHNSSLFHYRISVVSSFGGGHISSFSSSSLVVDENSRSSLEFDFDTLHGLGVAIKAVSPQINLSKLPNGLKVVSVDFQRPDSSITLVIPAAGTRYETSAGLAHVYKNFLFKSSERRTAFRLTRELENKGVNMGLSLGREFLTMTIRGLRPFLSDAMEFALDTLTHPKFAHYEFDSIKDLVKLETFAAESCGFIYTLDQLHRAAYRSGLGYSLFASLPTLDNVTLDQIKLMSNQVLQSVDSMILVGINMKHDLLTKMAERDLGLLKKTPTTSKQTTTHHRPMPSKYYGGDIHQDRHGPAGHWMMAFEGPGRNDKDYLATAMIYALLGANQGVHLNHVPSMSILGEVSSQDSSIKTICRNLRAIHVDYTDSSLVGVYVEVDDTKCLPNFVDRIIRTFRQLKLTEERMIYARSQLKWFLAQSLSSCHGSLTNSLISQLLSSTEKPPTLSRDFLDQIDKLTMADVTRALQRLLSTKPSSSFYGPLRDAPFLDQF
jgi:ubiquinol-cytochrome c reductase core subunit 2